MRRPAILVAGALASAFVALDAQQPATPQTPVFRGAVDVIRLDVSVLDKDHRPIHGLKAGDFTVIEDGKPQRVVAVSEIDAISNDPTPSAWMRHIPRDTAANDLVDQIGDGRIFAVVLDDFNLPWDDTGIVMAARGTARYILDMLGPSDIGAVVFPMDAGRTQDFTEDRDALLAAVDRFDPHAPPIGFDDRTPTGPGPGGGDMPQRFSPVLMRSQCQRRQPTIPALHVLVSRLASIPNRRKTLFLVSTGVPIDYGARRGCEEMLADEMKEVLRIAQRSNINIHSVDPAGYNGYEDYLKNPLLNARRFPPTAAPGNTTMAVRLRRDFLEITSQNTGARAVVNTNDVEAGIDRIFTEESSYYLLGYETSNGKPDGKFRKVQVKVNRPDVSVRTQAGYYAANEDSLTTPESKLMPASSDLGLTGIMGAPGLPLVATAVPLALAGSAASHDAVVGVVLTVRLPPPQKTLSELLTVTRNVYDGDGRVGPPAQEKWPMTLQPSSGDSLRYDVVYKLTLAPGRHQIRLNAHSVALDKAGTVFADVDVPDFTKAPLTLSGIALGTRVAATTPRSDALAQVLPIVPTSARDFAPSDPVTAFVRVYQGGMTEIAAVTINVRLVDVGDAVVFDQSETLRPESFDAGRGAGFQVSLPLERLPHGPYVLSVGAETAGVSPVRRDLVFKVR